MGGVNVINVNGKVHGCVRCGCCSAWIAVEADVVSQRCDHGDEGGWEFKKICVLNR